MTRGTRNFVLAIAITAQIAGAALATPAKYQQSRNPHRANELVLAGIHPGRDKIDAVEKKFPRTLSRDTLDASAAHVWIEPCSNRRISLDADDSGTIQSITIESPKPLSESTCAAAAKNAASRASQFWKTGRGLTLGDTKQRVIEIYGKPGSAGPSVKNGRELELLYYAFDWAGPDVPQVMEISCDRATGRVVEIMLAFPSL
jgi:hypothetical protein